MNELQILVKQQPGVISTNFEEIKAELSAQMEIYKELEVTEDNKPERKKDIATLRKIAKAVNDKKVEVKNEFMKPYTAFEENVKQLIEIINEPIVVLDNQVKEFEEKQRIQKQEMIKAIYLEMIVDYPDIMQDEIGLTSIYDSKWENISVSIKAVKDDMASRLNKIRDDIALINSMASDKTLDALKGYIVDLDLNKAMSMITRYEQQKKEIQARLEAEKKAEEERVLQRERERVREEERKRIRDEELIREEERRKAAEVEERIREEERIATEKRLMSVKALDPAPVDDLEAPFEVTDEIRTTFTVQGTEEELEQVGMYLNSIGLTWERKDTNE